MPRVRRLSVVAQQAADDAAEDQAAQLSKQQAKQEAAERAAAGRSARLEEQQARLAALSIDREARKQEAADRARQKERQRAELVRLAEEQRILKQQAQEVKAQKKQERERAATEKKRELADQERVRADLAEVARLPASSRTGGATAATPELFYARILQPVAFSLGSMREKCLAPVLNELPTQAALAFASVGINVINTAYAAGLACNKSDAEEAEAIFDARAGGPAIFVELKEEFWKMYQPGAAPTGWAVSFYWLWSGVLLKFRTLNSTGETSVEVPRVCVEEEDVAQVAAYMGGWAVQREGRLAGVGRCNTAQRRMIKPCNAVFRPLLEQLMLPVGETLATDSMVGSYLEARMLFGNLVVLKPAACVAFWDRASRFSTTCFLR
mmetsp:Transcript_18219/g.38854  ORF Transcript_18219/g.38854 Transcript_18219/m.38854 type:complete len:383 (+) Transcript_18219:395-1543(+)